jgi:hypothetical protein
MTKSIVSDQERSMAVRNFIHARYQGLAKISRFDEVVEYLNEKRVRVLSGAKPSGREYVGVTAKPRVFYTYDDAEVYFNWLMAVVTGAEKVAEDVIDEAINQIFVFILIMRQHGHLTMADEVTLIAPYNWEDRLVSFEEKLTTIQTSMEKRDGKITEVLSKIYAWMKEYTSVLDEVKKDYQNQLGKIDTE